MKVYKVLRFLMLPALLLAITPATQAQAPSHDPTQMVEDGGRYWIFTTGNEIWHMSASNTDFTDWRPEGGVFESVPEWINDYVPGFERHFWAPGIIYMNGKWHLYYSCSTFGSQTSAIGLVTTPSIADSAWTDQGMVVYSNSNRAAELGYNVNAIDADVMRDKEGRAWLLYGSYWQGLVMTELDTVTGKPIDETDLHHVADGNPEAGYVMSHGDYYYIFFNRGACCSSVRSTYRILMGRSGNPAGPFYDKDSVMTHQGGGSSFLHSDGRFVGPGHFGYGHGKLTYHYYDGQANGAPRLGIANIEWGEDGWPKAMYQRAGTLSDGTYMIVNDNSGKALDLANNDTLSGTNVIQHTANPEDTTQHWQVTYIGDGYYKISPVQAPGKALEIAGCASNSGGNAQIGDHDSLACQRWYIPRMSNGGLFRIMADHSSQSLEIASASSGDGANVQQWPFNREGDQQWKRWRFIHPDDVVVDEPDPEPVAVNQHEKAHFKLYPNPTNGNFAIQLANNKAHSNVQLEIYRMDGRLVHSSEYGRTNHIYFTGDLASGMYHVKLIAENNSMIQKLIVK